MTDDATTPSESEIVPQPQPLPRRRPEESRPTDPNSVSGNDGYRIVTDLVAGPNLRWRDNLFQGLFILIALLLSVAVGAAFWGVEGAVIGGVGGLIGGLLLSGAVLGLYRAYRHMQGKHD
jgi:hypothetical protein